MLVGKPFFFPPNRRIFWFLSYLSTSIGRIDLNQSALDFYTSSGSLVKIWTPTETFCVRWSTLKVKRSHFFTFLAHFFPPAFSVKTPFFHFIPKISISMCRIDLNRSALGLQTSQKCFGRISYSFGVLWST